jgi:LacI family transcriptional regulator
VTALELLDALVRRGRRVPESMSVVGFDDIPVAGHARVGLTTVRQDAEEMGGVAAEMLLEAIANGRHPSRRVLLPTELVVRTSTGPAPEG